MINLARYILNQINKTYTCTCLGYEFCFQQHENVTRQSYFFNPSSTYLRVNKKPITLDVTVYIYFSNTTSCHWLSVNKIEGKIKRLFELGTFTANKIILSRDGNLQKLTLAELVDKSRKEIVKTVIKRVKITYGFFVV